MRSLGPVPQRIRRRGNASRFIRATGPLRSIEPRGRSARGLLHLPMQADVGEERPSGAGPFLSPCATTPWILEDRSGSHPIDSTSDVLIDHEQFTSDVWHDSLTYYTLNANSNYQHSPLCEAKSKATERSKPRALVHSHYVHGTTWFNRALRLFITSKASFVLKLRTLLPSFPERHVSGDGETTINLPKQSSSYAK